MNEYLLPIAVITVLILINGLFVAAEFGIAAAPRTRIQQLAEEGVAAARHVLATLRTPRLLNRYISTAQVGITLASLGLGSSGEHAVAELIVRLREGVDWLASAAAHTIATVEAVGLLTYLLVVVGEMVPGSQPPQHPGETAKRLNRTMTIFGRIFLPLTA